MFSSRTGVVEVLVDYQTVSQQADPVEFIRTQAISELSLQNRYSDDEVTFVKDDQVLKESCRKAWLKARGHATRIPFDTYKAQQKGKEYVAPPTQYRLKLQYTRPHSRGWLDREV